MTTLLHYIQPWMQKSIGEAEDQIENKVAQQTERKILAVNQCFDLFELRDLAQPSPTIYLMTIQVSVASLRADVDAIFDVWVPESEATLAEPTKYTVLAALFTTSTAPLPPPREHAKWHLSRESEEA